MKKTINVNVNGKLYSRDIEPNMTLLSFLREELGLTGTKEGCGEGACGACTVLVDDDAVNSCIYLALDVDGKSVLTVEGLAKDGKLCDLQQSFVENGAIQCGFCTPGMLMSAIGLLRKEPHPNEEQIRMAISGNLCRCTGYTNIVKAIQSVCTEKNDG